MRPFKKTKLTSHTLNTHFTTGESNRASKITHDRDEPFHLSNATNPAPDEMLTKLLDPETVSEKKNKFNQEAIADRALKKSRPHKHWSAPVDSGQRDVLTEQDVAALLDCEQSTVQEKARNGDLPGVKFGRSWVFPKTSLLQSLHADAMRNLTPVRLPNGHAFGFDMHTIQPQRRRGPPPTLPPL